VTDYFALLDLPRRPWTDDEELKRRYHAKGLTVHPDAAGSATKPGGFAEVNEAYQTLRDPRRRLQHLLALSDVSAGSPPATVPSAIQDLFLEIGAATQRADALLGKLRLTSNALARGLLHAETLRVRAEVEQLLVALVTLEDAAVQQLRALDEEWECAGAAHVASARRLESTFAYLGRWIAQVREKQFQLATV